MVIVEETTTINLLNQQSLTTIYKHLCLYPEISVEFTPLQENFPLQLTKTTTVKPQPINMQSFEAYCQWIHLQTLPYLRLREHFKVCVGGVQTVCRSLRMRESDENVSPSNLRSDTHKLSPT